MSLDALSAAKAYANAATAAARQSAPSVQNTDRPNFQNLVAEAVSQTVSSIEAGEAVGIQAANGEADLVDVVTAISAAEVSLEAAIAVRNRVIEAYQEIMRMPI
ncbi:MAG: flagellar hook-basal body complex protein FliE [Pseudomonadota bacterium]